MSAQRIHPGNIRSHIHMTYIHTYIHTELLVARDADPSTVRRETSVEPVRIQESRDMDMERSTPKPLAATAPTAESTSDVKGTPSETKRN